MMISQLRAQLAVLKAAPIYNKGAAAEKALEVAVTVLADFEVRISQLEKGAGHGNATKQDDR